MKKLTALAAICSAPSSLTVCDADAAKPKAKEQAPLTEEQKTLYALGVLMSQSLSTFDLKPEELAQVQKGLADGVSGVKSDIKRRRIHSESAGTAARAHGSGRREGRGGRRHLPRQGVEGSGRHQDRERHAHQAHARQARAPSPAATDQVKVHYEGRLIDGKVFDSSIARGEPATFPLNGVIACWTEGVQTMKVGGKAQLVCPANLAYGANGSPPTIPPQATLVFDVELLEIVK